jgi:pyruvate/2-oxoacid:ferredoxin oxidoreductase beta subunit
MTSLLNQDRPPLYCPGCSHERVVHGLDRSFQELGLAGNEIAIVTDIGCSGLFDTFFHTHALHGLHGRALTYATGLKLACPSLCVVVIMGDGGLGIGGAHVLSSCRRNLDITLLVLNNFNYGMTGGQCSATTPVEALTSSSFLGQLEAPLDICAVASSAGATWIDRVSATDSTLSARISQAISNHGFSLIDITGICTGRFARRNKQAGKRKTVKATDFSAGFNPNPQRSADEYGSHYRRRCEQVKPPGTPVTVVPRSNPTISGQVSALFLGAAGQRINTAAEVFCLAAMNAGLIATLKSDYPITVMRGHSISEVMLSPDSIGFTSTDSPDIIFALAEEGVGRRNEAIHNAGPACLIMRHAGIPIPATSARVVTFDLTPERLKPNQWALAFLALLTNQHTLLDIKLLKQGLQIRFAAERLSEASEIVDRCRAVAPLTED